MTCFSDEAVSLQAKEAEEPDFQTLQRALLCEHSEVLKGEVQSCMAFLQVHSFEHENNHELFTNLNACFVGLRLGHNLTKFSPWF